MTSDNNREKELIGKIAAGDRAAMKAFYDDYSGYLTAVCRRYIARRDEVKDVLQECFIKIFGSMGRFEYRGVGTLKAWTGRIVANESLKYIRERNRLRVSGEVENIPDEDGDGEPDFVNIPVSAILEMIGSLPEGYRTVFNLYVFEGMSHREIASILNIAENSSASQLHRARNLLAGKIKKYRYE